MTISERIAIKRMKPEDRESAKCEFYYDTDTKVKNALAELAERVAKMRDLVDANGWHDEDVRIFMKYDLHNAYQHAYDALRDGVRDLDAYDC